MVVTTRTYATTEKRLVQVENLSEFLKIFRNFINNTYKAYKSLNKMPSYTILTPDAGHNPAQAF
jgi:hypothetical protein